MSCRQGASGAADVIILDRYIYDELANLPLSNSVSRVFVRLVAAFGPEPDVAYLLDADPEAARARKPEYPVDFMHECRRAYFLLAGILGSHDDHSAASALPKRSAKWKARLAIALIRLAGSVACALAELDRAQAA